MEMGVINTNRSLFKVFCYVFHHDSSLVDACSLLDEIIARNEYFFRNLILYGSPTQPFIATSNQHKSYRYLHMYKTKGGCQAMMTKKD